MPCIAGKQTMGNFDNSFSNFSSVQLDSTHSIATRTILFRTWAERANPDFEAREICTVLAVMCDISWLVLNNGDTCRSSQDIWIQMKIDSIETHLVPH